MLRWVSRLTLSLPFLLEELPRPTGAAACPPRLGLCGGRRLQASSVGGSRCCDFLWRRQRSGFLWCKQEVRLCRHGSIQLREEKAGAWFGRGDAEGFRVGLPGDPHRALPAASRHLSEVWDLGTRSLVVLGCVGFIGTENRDFFNDKKCRVSARECRV